MRLTRPRKNAKYFVRIIIQRWSNGSLNPYMEITTGPKKTPKVILRPLDLFIKDKTWSA